ncbi:MAG: hypothetical protein JWM96_666 [Alphaproteobacteria bacterium]|nr:hypothetical protein [Alphaproteobacteria bacterium]
MQKYLLVLFFLGGLIPLLIPVAHAQTSTTQSVTTQSATRADPNAWRRNDNYMRGDNRNDGYDASDPKYNAGNGYNGAYEGYFPQRPINSNGNASVRGNRTYNENSRFSHRRRIRDNDNTGNNRPRPIQGNLSVVPPVTTNVIVNQGTTTTTTTP